MTAARAAVAPAVIEKLSRRYGAVGGIGVDWYLLGDAKAPRRADWTGFLFTGEVRVAVLPLALRTPAFQAFIAQVLIGARYVVP